MNTGNRLRTAGGGLLLGWGGALMLRPESTVRAACGPAPAPPHTVVRLLGTRRLAQQLLLLLVPSRRLAVAASGADVLHTMSMLVAAQLWPQYRRAAVTSAGVAAVSAALSAATRQPRRRRGHRATPTERPHGPHLRLAD